MWRASVILSCAVGTTFLRSTHIGICNAVTCHAWLFCSSSWYISSVLLNFHKLAIYSSTFSRPVHDFPFFVPLLLAFFVNWRTRITLPSLYLFHEFSYISADIVWQPLGQFTGDSIVPQRHLDPILRPVQLLGPHKMWARSAKKTRPTNKYDRINQIDNTTVKPDKGGDNYTGVQTLFKRCWLSRHLRSSSKR